MKPPACLVPLAAVAASLALGAVAHAAEIPRVDQRPHRVDYDPSLVPGYVLKQPLLLSKLDPRKPHTVFLRSPVKPERMYARDPATGKSLAESTAHHQLKDENGNVVYVSRLALKAFTPDAELIVQMSNKYARWAALLLCDAVVVNGNDTGVGSLRGEIAGVRNGGSVCFDPVVFDVAGAPVVRLTGEILVGKGVDVHGTTSRPRIDVDQRDRAMQFGVGFESSLDDLQILDGTATRGGLILNRDRLTLRNVSLYGGLAGDGGAIYNDVGARLTMRKSSLSGNEATRGGGVFSDDAELLLFETRVDNNTADQGGGLFVKDAGLFLHDLSRVDSNEAIDGGGIYLSDASYHGTNELWGGVVTTNVAQGRGGGVFIDGGELVIDFEPSDPFGFHAVDGNVATDGGGVYVDTWARVEVRLANHIANNGSVERGGGVFNAGHLVLVGGAVVDENLAEDGGGVYNTGYLELNRVARIAANDAYKSGGGVYNAPGAELHGWTRDVRITDNDAILGGGSGAGGGVANFGSGIVDVLSTVIVGNRPSNLVNIP